MSINKNLFAIITPTKGIQGAGLDNIVTLAMLYVSLLQIYRPYLIAAMDPAAYLKKHHVLTYVEDAVTLLLERKDEDSKTKPFELLTDYFKSVRDGSHVLFREHNFISATPHNRRSFIAAFWQSYEAVAGRREPLESVEYHSLLRLLCYNFPMELSQKVSKVLMGNSRIGNAIPFAEFSYVFQIVFYFEKFLGQLESACGGRLSPSSLHTHSSTAVVVPLPLALNSTDSSRPNTSLGSEKSLLHPATDVWSTNISTNVFLQTALELVQLFHKNPGKAAPSVEAVAAAAGEGENTSICGFVLKLSADPLVNSEIGVLPSRT